MHVYGKRVQKLRFRRLSLTKSRRFPRSEGTAPAPMGNWYAEVYILAEFNGCGEARRSSIKGGIK
jgi:hypothetical protein